FARYLRSLADTRSDEDPVKWMLAPDRVWASHEVFPFEGEVAADSEMHIWRNMMSLTSGYHSVESAMLNRAKLAKVAESNKVNIPISRLAPPAITGHPWKEMLTRISARPKVEDWARIVPADFYAVRA